MNKQKKTISKMNLEHLDRHDAIDRRAIRAAVRQEIELVDIARQHFYILFFVLNKKTRQDF